MHNYEDRSSQEVIPSSDLFLGHFSYTPRNKRTEDVPTADEVLGHFHERLHALSEEQMIAESKRCII